MACGVVSGVLSGVIANPTDVLKVRLQANSCTELTFDDPLQRRQSLWRAFQQIYRDEGMKGLYRVRGFWPYLI